MIIEDIHLNDKSLRENYINKFLSDVSVAFNILDESQLTGKKNIASIINQITTLLVEVQGLSDSDFKQRKIQVTDTTPTTPLESGEVYFKEI